MASPPITVDLDEEFVSSLSQNRCVNRVHLVGRLVAPPRQTALSSRTDMTTLWLVTAEWFGKQRDQHHLNFHEIQVLGKDSPRAAEFAPGAWVVIDGFERTVNQRGERRLVVRTFAIRSWEEADDPLQTAPAGRRS